MSSTGKTFRKTGQIPLYGMPKERYDELMSDNGTHKLTEEERAGWHFCADWDFLLIHRLHPEADACTCLKSMIERSQNP